MQTFIHRRMDKFGNSYNTLLYSNENEWVITVHTGTHKKLFQSRKQFEQETKFTDGCIYNAIIFMKFKNKQAIILFMDTYVSSKKETFTKNVKKNTYKKL